MTKFCFYSVLKNEDANPYVGDNILVVADGLGGAGSAVHQIDRAIHPVRYMHRDIWASAFGDLQNADDSIKRYVDALIAPMTDAKDDTSALWASRIVIGRCVYALTKGDFKDADLAQEDVRRSLAAFITSGLDKTAAKFGLQKGRYDGQLLLPTTLAFIRFAEKGKKKTVAEVVWAGDSRCYAFIKSGKHWAMKLLSVDDEDASGAITNLFYSGNQKVRLNYRRYELDGPCVLMAVSDGVFDPFEPHDHLGVENTVLSTIEASETEQELQNSLKTYFDAVHGDDATMAFASVGFADFAALKKALHTRAQTIAKLAEVLATRKEEFNVRDLPEEEARHYVAARMSDKFDQIVSLLTDAAMAAAKDAALTDDIKAAVTSVHDKQVDALKEERAAARDDALDNLKEYAQANPEQADEIFVPDAAKKIKGVAALIKKAKALAAKKAKAEAVKAELERLKECENELASRLKGEKAAVVKALQSVIRDRKLSKKAHKRLAHKLLDRCIDLEEMEKAVFGKDDVSETAALCPEDKPLAKDVKDLRNKKKTAKNKRKDCHTDIKQAEKSYIRGCGKPFDEIKSNAKLEAGLSPSCRQKAGLDSLPSTDVSPDKAAILQLLSGQKEAVVEGIVSALAENYTSTSVIDSQFNAGKLSQFRAYYRQKNKRDASFDRLCDRLAAVEAEYERLSKDEKKDS